MKRYKDIKEPLDKFYEDVKVDHAFAKDITKAKYDWITKDVIYSQFLGEPYIGVYDIRYSSQDRDRLFIDILGVDISYLKSEILDVKDMKESFTVATDPVYVSLVYLMHKVMKSRLGSKDKDQLISDLYYLFAFKVTGSLTYHYFKLYNVFT